MFTKFFYDLRDAGLKVTFAEFLTLQEALDKGLANNSVTDFYYLCRMILVKSETEYDKFDMVFENNFKGTHYEPEVGANMLKWLDKSEMDEFIAETERQWLNQMEDLQIDKDDVEEKFRARLKDQDSEHNGGSHWIGTMGKTSFGNTGGNIGWDAVKDHVTNISIFGGSGGEFWIDDIEVFGYEKFTPIE